MRHSSQEYTKSRKIKGVVHALEGTSRVAKSAGASISISAARIDSNRFAVCAESRHASADTPHPPDHPPQQRKRRVAERGDTPKDAVFSLLCGSTAAARMRGYGGRRIRSKNPSEGTKPPPRMSVLPCLCCYRCGLPAHAHAGAEGVLSGAERAADGQGHVVVDQALVADREGVLASLMAVTRSNSVF